MAKTKIAWTEHVWNPTAGCDKVSPGCKFCYALREARRLRYNPNPKISSVYRDVVTPKGTPLNWTGKVELIESKLQEPLRWRKPRLVFVDSMSDLFHQSLPDEAIDRVFAVMALCPQHTFQVLTKRAERMWKYATAVNGSERFHDINLAAQRIVGSPGWGAVLPTQRDGRGHGGWPLPNVHLGVSVEDQATADERIPWLLKTPAAVRFVSYEPALGPVNFEPLGVCRDYRDGTPEEVPGLDWVIVGGESGPGARPMHPDWARSVRDQCQAAGVPFFFKQWGEWQDGSEPGQPKTARIVLNDGRYGTTPDDFSMETVERWGEFRPCMMAKVGKKAAGALLDGRAWTENPEVAR